MKISVRDYGRMYRRHIAQLLKRQPGSAMSSAVGGNFESFGVLMKQILSGAGLRETDYLIDVGCGSGRLAHVLSINRYLGTDVVPELLAHARSLCPLPGWRFELVDDIVIPEADAVADMVCFFSVFTHLLHEDSYRYLLEAWRVLKPAGKVVFSFLEFRAPCTWPVFAHMVAARAAGTQMHHNQFLSRDAIEAWATRSGFRVEALFDGGVPHIPLTQPLTFDDGRTVEGCTNLGQSVCILRKP